MEILNKLGNRTQTGNRHDSPEKKAVMENIAKVDAEIQQKIYELGQTYYMENKGKNSDEITMQYVPLIESVKKLEENRKGYYKSMLRLDGQMLCENCGAIIPYGSIYCNHCGQKAEEIAGDAGNMMSGAGTGRCSQCGAMLEAGSMFCTSCGAKVG